MLKRSIIFGSVTKNAPPRQASFTGKTDALDISGLIRLLNEKKVRPDMLEKRIVNLNDITLSKGAYIVSLLLGKKLYGPKIAFWEPLEAKIVHLLRT